MRICIYSVLLNLPSHKFSLQKLFDAIEKHIKIYRVLMLISSLWSTLYGVFLACLSFFSQFLLIFLACIAYIKARRLYTNSSKYHLISFHASLPFHYLCPSFFVNLFDLYAIINSIDHMQHMSQNYTPHAAAFAPKIARLPEFASRTIDYKNRTYSSI